MKFLARFQLEALSARYPPRLVLAVYALINGCLCIGLMSFLASGTGSPLIFPSLGPTAFVCFITPLEPSASPRNIVLGHGLGAALGYASLWGAGLAQAGPAQAGMIGMPRVMAAALALGLTAGAMVLSDVPHPPAGATTLIVALGFMSRPHELAVLMLGVVLLTVQIWVINRLAGLPYPLWSTFTVVGPEEDDAPQ